ncbi:MAG: 50S ribosomal protein L6 [Gammaproteobacteria bacterium]|jgi:large subunit ribosomal protein L6
MSRIAKQPVEFGKDVSITLAGSALTVKGPKGSLSMNLNSEVEVETDDASVRVAPRSRSGFATAIAGTTRSLINNMVTGVTSGFEKKLELVGVGYRAQAQGKKVSLSLGFSHPVVYDVPEGVTVETPAANEIVVRGIDRQAVGQVAAELRRYRPPEPYKGKGVRYANERIVMKEAKKK